MKLKAQLKFVVDKALAEAFKQAVLSKHGTLKLSKEGQEALRLYLQRENLPSSPGRDSLLAVIGIAKSAGRTRPNALADKKALFPRSGRVPG